MVETYLHHSHPWVLKYYSYVTNDSKSTYKSTDRPNQTRNQIEGGFLGTLPSIGVPMAISLVLRYKG